MSRCEMSRHHYLPLQFPATNGAGTSRLGTTCLKTARLKKTNLTNLGNANFRPRSALGPRSGCQGTATNMRRAARSSRHLNLLGIYPPASELSEARHGYQSSHVFASFGFAKQGFTKRREILAQIYSNNEPIILKGYMNCESFQKLKGSKLRHLRCCSS